MQRIHASVKILFVACSTLVVTACGAENTTPSIGKVPLFAVTAAQPDTLHVVPFFEFHTAQSIIGPGSSGGLIGTPATGLYGVAAFGGDLKCQTRGSHKGCGFVYRLTQNTTTGEWQLKKLHRFDGDDGREPTAALFKTKGGLLVGTTAYGGEHNKGTVFELDPSGASFKVLYSFGSKRDDGAYPYAGIVELKDVSGRRLLYGTASAGGAYTTCGYSGGCGIVYSVDEQPPYTERVLHSFGRGHDGAIPFAPLIHVSGALYGTTSQGGDSPSGCGTVFRISTTGAEKVLHSFKNSPDDGCTPLASVVQLKSIKGILYGTTSAGGRAKCECGTAYSVTTTGKEALLHHFSGGRDGSTPDASLIAVDGSLYGVTVAGGAQCTGYPHGCGVIFSLMPSTAGPPQLLRLFAFKGGLRGAEPAAPLHARVGVFYGTTSAGGTAGFGAVYRFRLSPATVTTR